MSDQAKQIEAQNARLKKQVEMGAALERLQSNRDFKKLILEGYFGDEAIRLVKLKASPEMQTPDKQASVLREIDAIGSFQGHLLAIEHFAVQAKSTMTSNEQELEVLAQED